MSDGFSIVEVNPGQPFLADVIVDDHPRTIDIFSIEVNPEQAFVADVIVDDQPRTIDIIADGGPLLVEIVSGSQGDPGPQGEPGSGGPPGANGATGPAGPTGPASTVPGPPGPAGATGATGPAGAAGATGATGATGPAGATGATGPPGSANITGAVAGQLTIAGSPTSITSSVPTSTFLTPAVAASTYAPIASPTFTGDPKAPTPATADNDTSIATTAYVQAQGYATSAAMTAADNLHVLKAGDAMSGALSINNTAANTYGLFMSASAVTGQSEGALIQAGTNASDFGLRVMKSAGASDIFMARGDGVCLNTSGTWTAISDVSTKTAIEPYARGLDEITKLNPVSFQYTEKSPFGGDNQIRYGLVAQEVAPHIPEAVGVFFHGDDELMTVDPGHMIYALINGMKELKAQLDALQAQLAAKA